MNPIRATPTQTLEERFEQLIKLNIEKDAQLNYLRRKLDQAMRNNQKRFKAPVPIVDPRARKSRPRKKLVILARRKEGLGGLRL